MPDKEDKCPQTAVGATVDTSGCALDTDGDGVPDHEDRCPHTSHEAQVDATGCDLDTDSDGVPDREDRCPKTTAGAAVDQNGCSRDTDADGVPDGLDLCSHTPPGVKVDHSGCPGDRDRDGVPDPLDQCPDSPAGSTVEESGCPPPPLRTSVGEISVLGVIFAPYSARIDANSHTVLDEVAAYLKRSPTVRVEIGGHTDSRGSALNNKKLSVKRAEAVRDYLVARGVSPQQLTVSGYGESRPLASNTTPLGRSRNRRIEFKILSK